MEEFYRGCCLDSPGSGPWSIGANTSIHRIFVRVDRSMPTNCVNVCQSLRRLRWPKDERGRLAGWARPGLMKWVSTASGPKLGAAHLRIGMDHLVRTIQMWRLGQRGLMEALSGRPGVL